MKKNWKFLCLLIACVFLLAACTPDGGQTTPEITVTTTQVPTAQATTKSPTTETPDTSAGPDIAAIMREFETLIASSMSTPKDIAQFIRDNIGKVGPVNASAMILGFEEMLSDYRAIIENKFYEREIQNAFQREDDYEIDLSDPANFKDEALKALIKETVDNGYKVERTEGSYFPVIDYSFDAAFSTYATDDIKEYISIMTVESDNTPAKDGGLIIGWDEVISRALRQERFIETYKESERLEQVAKLYDRYAYFTFFGLPNTPLFDYDANKFGDYIKPIYEEAVAKNPGSKYAEKIKGFLDVLSRNDYILTDEVEQYRSEFSF